ncbi:MAG: rRNA maturation RNase YbeY [Bacilli bacterium]|nr:rRNA maturation RNase YbeY [Bacilli bacterium]
MKIGLFNETEENIDDYFKEIKKVLERGLDMLDIKECEFNIIVVGNNYIHELNKTYRGIDRETDVISFALEDDKTFNLESRVLGDIYISIDRVYSQANDYGHSVLREFAFLAVHGMLHLLGYDHMNKSDEEVMFNLQEKILESAGITR